MDAHQIYTVCSHRTHYQDPKGPISEISGLIDKINEACKISFSFNGSMLINRVVYKLHADVHVYNNGETLRGPYWYGNPTLTDKASEKLKQMAEDEGVNAQLLAYAKMHIGPLRAEARKEFLLKVIADAESARRTFWRLQPTPKGCIMPRHKPRNHLEDALMKIVEGQVKSYIHDHPEANIPMKAVSGIRKRIVGTLLAERQRLEEALEKDRSALSPDRSSK